MPIPDNAQGGERIRLRADRIPVHIQHFGQEMQIIQVNGILYFNPCSPTDRFFAPYNSIGILELTDKIRGTIIRL